MFLKTYLDLSLALLRRAGLGTREKFEGRKIWLPGRASPSQLGSTSCSMSLQAFQGSSSTSSLSKSSARARLDFQFLSKARLELGSTFKFFNQKLDELLAVKRLHKHYLKNAIIQKLALKLEKLDKNEWKSSARARLEEILKARAWARRQAF